MFHLFAFFTLLAISTNATALDRSDIGNYAVIHRDGHVTDFTFHVSLTDTQWNIEQRQADGKWMKVTCSTDCVLHESSPQDIARFFPQDALKEASPSCVHNTAFAFCSLTLLAKPEIKGYTFIALVTPKPIPLRLKKLEEGWKDAQGRPVPNSDAQQTIDGFGGLLLLTSDADWEKKWNTQPEAIPHFTQAQTVRMGQKIFALTFFTNPMLNDKGEANITCDIELFKPDGAPTLHQADANCFKGTLQGKPHFLYLSAPVIGFVGEAGDPPGEWRIHITLKDTMRKVSLPLKTTFTLQ